MNRKELGCLAGALGLLLLSTCVAQRPLRAPDPLSVQACPQGTLSRHAPLRVVFTRAQAEGDFPRKLSVSPISFRPALRGTTSWVDERTLEFRPSRPLPVGQRLSACVELPKVEPFDFSFQVLPPSFRLAFGSLEASSNPGVFELGGVLETADEEQAAGIERVLRASLRGRPLPVAWNHEPEARRHAFRIMEITRADTVTLLQVAWSGASLDCRKTGRKEVTIPAADSFELLQVRTLPEQNCLEASFSEPLNARQDRTGLVRLVGRDDLSQALRGNLLRLYTDSALRSSETLIIEPGLQSADGRPLQKLVNQTVSVRDQLPAVRFVGSGVILPTSQGLTIPLETMNLRAVIVEAFHVFGDNMPQFLQVNTLEGSQELYRVGKVVWRKLIELPYTEAQRNSWVRHGLDVGALSKAHPDGMFQLRVSFRAPQTVWNCPLGEAADPIDWSKVPLVRDAPREDSYWDSYEEYYNREDYENRDNPCHPGYYKTYWQDKREVLAIRNLLVSNIGLLAKAEPERLFHVFCSDLRTAQPFAGVNLTLLDFQQKKIAGGQSDKNGMVSFRDIEEPSFIVAERLGQSGFLKVDGRSALVTSHFDVAGEVAKNGVKGFLYGERGVWRPGDPLYLTFILSDPLRTLPANHPLTLELRDPAGKLASRQTKTSAVGGFYAFTAGTDPNAPTGNWEARVKVGDRVFRKTVKVESVMPNRLKVAFDLPAAGGGLRAGQFSAKLQANWLHGAPAANLKVSLSVRLLPSSTSFSKYADFVFDDPAREFSVQDQSLFSGELDEQGRTVVNSAIQVSGSAPGKLAANFLVRVFEPSGVFSTEQFSRELSPYERYVGIRVPKGDEARGMLLTDKDQTLMIMLLDPEGNPVRRASLQAEIYKLNWRWWWEKGEENLAEFAESQAFKSLRSEKVSIVDGKGEWRFQIKYPDWGRYLIRVSDPEGGHSTGKVVYIDWPGWAGRSNEGKLGATMLTLSTDKKSYRVGETVSVSFPSNSKGRALIALEAGGRLIRKEWLVPGEGSTRYQFAAEAGMAPNVYVHVSFLQPHLQTANDLPIRLYGVVPVFVENPDSRLKPVIQVADNLRPGEQASITIKEAAGREMTYTLAIVDEGLLRINRYQTPDPWDVFYRREASMLKSWDLYDFVAGAYSGKLATLLAIGGGEDEFSRGERKASRFPPLVLFLGPATLKKGAANTHAVDIPQYIGAVRLMVVAGQAGAYGAAEKEVTVKSDLMVLPTLPRVLSVEEDIFFPVTLFNSREGPGVVKVSLSVSGPLSVAGEAELPLSFAKPEERTVRFRLLAGKSTGVARVRVSAEGGGAKAVQETEIEVRLPVSRQTQVLAATIQPGKSWQEEIQLPGLAGTNTIQLEAARIPPLDLGRNLSYLIRYPHGCVEQTTSAAFPQLYLDQLVRLPPKKAQETQANIEAALRKLVMFQNFAGGFAFWPGYPEASDWTSTYVGHFLLEAQRRGFTLPEEMLPKWIEFQKLRAESWLPGEKRGDLQQAYRLYTLALAGSPSVGAMNRLRELSGLSAVAGWRLAAAYFLAGQREEGQRLARNLSLAVERYQELGNTFGSELRDRAMILDSLVVLGLMEPAEDLAKQVSRQLSSGQPPGTQSTAYALLALARYALGTGPGKALRLRYSWAGQEQRALSAETPVLLEEIPAGLLAKGRLSIVNDSEVTLYPRLILQGLPALGSESASANGLSLRVSYEDANGQMVDPAAVALGRDLKVTIFVTNSSLSLSYEQLALSFLAPGSWEVANPRLVEPEEGGPAVSSYRDYQDIRDDRIYTYFALPAGQTVSFPFQATVAYSGVFYLPAVSVEAMYDPTIYARTAGRWLGRK